MRAGREAPTSIFARRAGRRRIADRVCRSRKLVSRRRVSASGDDRTVDGASPLSWSGTRSLLVRSHVEQRRGLCRQPGWFVATAGSARRQGSSLRNCRASGPRCRRRPLVPVSVRSGSCEERLPGRFVGQTCARADNEPTKAKAMAADKAVERRSTIRPQHPATHP